MPETPIEVAWWVMTGTIAGLLSLITLFVALIGYLTKTGVEKILDILTKLVERFADLQQMEASRNAACDERHKAVDRDMAEIKSVLHCRRNSDSEQLTT